MRWTLHTRYGRTECGDRSGEGREVGTDLIDGIGDIVPHGGREGCAGCGGRYLRVRGVREVSDAGKRERYQDADTLKHPSPEDRNDLMCMTHERERERERELKKFRMVRIHGKIEKIKHIYCIPFFTEIKRKSINSKLKRNSQHYYA